MNQNNIYEQKALYQQILDNPNDDQIRLIYADYLEEYGTEDWELAHAKYIKLAIENKNITYEERGKLVNKYGEKWGWLKYYAVHFTRGFPSRLSVTDYSKPNCISLEEYITYINDHPIQYMLIHEINTQQIEFLMKQPRYKHIKEVSIMNFVPDGTSIFGNITTVEKFIQNKTKMEIPDNMYTYLSHFDQYNFLKRLKKNGLEAIGINPSHPIDINPIIRNTYTIATQMGLQWINYMADWMPGE